MKPVTIILAAGAALLLLQSRRAVAQPAAVVVAGAPRQDYVNPSALAAQTAGRVLEGLIAGFRATPTPGAVANAAATETARAAVRAGDPYYGLGANTWYAGNTEEARAAVRAGDTYYTGAEAVRDMWTMDTSATAY